MKNYKIKEILFGSYTQNIDIDIQADNEKEAMKKYEKLDNNEILKHSKFDYDIEDGNGAEIKEL